MKKTSTHFFVGTNILQTFKFIYNTKIGLIDWTILFQVFEKLLETNSTDIFNKLVPVAGDVGEDNLGLSPADRQTLVDNVNVVIHSAATLDFQENLRPTVKINLLGTRRIVELCKQIKNLKVSFSPIYAHNLFYYV